jgi:hypothetical protein
MLPIEYTLEAEDIASARLLALGVRPRVEFSLFAAALVGLSAISVSNLSFGTLPLHANQQGAPSRGGGVQAQRDAAQRHDRAVGR